MFRSEQYQQAELIFKQIMARDDHIAEVWYGLGLLYQKVYPDSSIIEKYFQKVIDLSSRNAEAYFQLGSYYSNHEEWKDAERMLERAVKIDSTYERAWSKLIFVQEQLQKNPTELAARILPTIVIRNPNKTVLYSIYYN